MTEPFCLEMKKNKNNLQYQFSVLLWFKEPSAHVGITKPAYHAQTQEPKGLGVLGPEQYEAVICWWKVNQMRCKMTTRGLKTTKRCKRDTKRPNKNYKETNKDYKHHLSWVCVSESETSWSPAKYYRNSPCLSQTTLQDLKHRCISICVVFIPRPNVIWPELHWGILLWGEGLENVETIRHARKDV